MVERLRLLWIAESEDDARALDRAEQALSCTFERRRLRASECEVALAEGTWELIVCSVSRDDRENALAGLAGCSRDALPQLIVVADEFEDVALDAYALGALVCERGRLPVQLTAAMRHVMNALENRMEVRGTRAFEQGQRDVLERIAAGAPVPELLAAIVRLVELQSDDMLCSILLVDRERSKLFHGASSSLPVEFVRAIDGASIGPNLGSCGAAAFRGERVIVEDITTHTNWADYRGYAIAHGLRACWSSPIFSPDQSVLGTFAMYYRVARAPTPREIGWVDRATHLASIALVRDRGERALRQSDRLESLSTLAGGIAHDFNNILTAIAGNVHLVSGDLGVEHPSHESLAEIDRACVRAADLVSQILAFSRHREAKRRAVQIEPIVEEAMQQLRATVPASIRVSARYYASLPEAFADPEQLKQIVMNLGRNAAHAIGQRAGTVTLHAERVEVIDRFPIGASELKAGTYVRLDISDTGAGMATATLARIFDPFFTTKEPGQGAGLGLSVVHGIVKSHEGAIDVRSTTGEGSCFSVYLPAASALPLVAARPASRVAARGEGERVLCIDDEAPVVRVTAQMLRRLGFRVVGQTDPADALAAFEAEPAQFDVVLTDFAMPRLSCFDLVRAIQRVRPGLPIVVTSGRIDAEDIERLRGLGIHEVVFKPSTIAELSSALRRALRSARAG
jgi:signal transduction histidine kinase/ActR/RegA family two-component response regulator